VGNLTIEIPGRLIVANSNDTDLPSYLKRMGDFVDKMAKWVLQGGQPLTGDTPFMGRFWYSIAKATHPPPKSGDPKLRQEFEANVQNVIDLNNGNLSPATMKRLWMSMATQIMFMTPWDAANRAERRNLLIYCMIIDKVQDRGYPGTYADYWPSHDIEFKLVTKGEHSEFEFKMKPADELEQLIMRQAEQEDAEVMQVSSASGRILLDGTHRTVH
jgi:hypothetical protein